MKHTFTIDTFVRDTGFCLFGIKRLPWPHLIYCQLKSDNKFHQHLKDKNAFKMSSSKYRPFCSGLILSYAWRELYTWPINKQSTQRNCLTSQNISLNVQLTITFQRRLLGGKVSKFNGQSVVCLNWEWRKLWRSASLENIVILNRQGLLLHKLIIRNHSKDK